MSTDSDPEGFAIIPRWLQQDPSYAGYVKLVYLSLASHVNRAGITSLSHKRMAEEASCSVASVKRALDLLRDLGVVSWTEQHRQGGTGQTSNIYQLIIGNAAYSRPNLPADPSSEGADPGSAGATPQLSQSQGVAQGELPKNESQKNESQKNEISLVPGSAVDQQPARRDVLSLVQLLTTLLAENDNEPARIPIHTWSDSARLLLDRDGIALAEAERVMRWCQADSFWAPNVLSMPTFRKQFVKLRAKMRAEQSGRAAHRPSAVQHNLDLVAQIRASQQGAIQ